MVKHTQCVGCHWEIVWVCIYNIYYIIYIYIYILYIYIYIHILTLSSFCINVKFILIIQGDIYIYIIYIYNIYNIYIYNIRYFLKQRNGRLSIYWNSKRMVIAMRVSQTPKCFTTFLEIICCNNKASLVNMLV